MGRGLPQLGLSLDCWGGGSGRSFWFGFWCRLPGPVDRVMETCPTHMKANRTFTDDDAERHKDYWRLKSPLSKEDSRLPIHERYSGESYFGIYDLEPRAGKPALNLDRTTEFFTQVVRPLPDFRDSYELDCDLEGVPAKRRHKEYSISVRLARAFIRKRIVLTCDECAFDPCDRIGGLAINPRSLLDIHHKNPRALSGKRWTKLCDLALLCPTCHRLAHAKMRAKMAATK